MKNGGILRREYNENFINKYSSLEPIKKLQIRLLHTNRNIWNDAKERSIALNILKQQLKSDTPYEKLSTDITYLYYSKVQKAYLSAVKDLATGEIVSYEVLPQMGIELSLNVIEKLPKNKITNKTMIHSDQGVHYTNLVYRMKLKENKIIQSISRKGHCLGNAPIESFFGHFKDECYTKTANHLKSYN
ncbi:DDE-type integrase/transposase/recombinase [Mollicutes bacterium LVI A0078]|nr:DDE-type integrase/transposase/recombinase [Mollicutes bacterium LVI A0075]WOO90725.1 DDE-type integrase/transposase/recombinase [Mollicutes bacterium LVI A0078]